LQQLEGVSKKYNMDSSGAPLLIDGLKRGCLSPELLELREGAVVMGTKNIPSLGIANGTLGTVISFEPGTNLPTIETMDGRCITVQPVEWAVEENGKKRATITQIPLRLAWAITVHKSQGMSMDAAAIDLSRAFEYGQGYVALSRVRTLAGLNIVGWSEEALMVHPRVRSEDEQFREHSEQAIRPFEALEASGDRAELEKNFVKASNGAYPEPDSDGVVRPVPKGKKSETDTYSATLALIDEATSIEQIATSRKLTLPTICTHLEKLRTAGRLSPEKISSLLSPETHDLLPRIFETFDTNKSSSLSLAFTTLEQEIPYDTLRIARMLYVPQL
jgi:ATP-dependent DNA helicase PIF1